MVLNIVEKTVSGHGTIPDEIKVTDHLTQFMITTSDKAPRDMGAAFIPSSARSDVLVEDRMWRASCVLEQSRALAYGLFADSTMSFFSADEGHDFGYWLDGLVSVWEGCEGVLNLEW